MKTTTQQKRTMIRKSLNMTLKDYSDYKTLQFIRWADSLSNIHNVKNELVIFDIDMRLYFMKRFNEVENDFYSENSDYLNAKINAANHIKSLFNDYIQRIFNSYPTTLINSIIHGSSKINRKQNQRIK